jgi:hypothetical protein
MKNIKIDRDYLYKLYMEKVDLICKEHDWVTDFGPREIVDMISFIIEDNPDILNINDK